MAEEAENFGGRMRERRRELRITQREVAERVEGKTEGKDISRYETGKHLPGPDTRAAIARALDTDLADLYQGPKEKRKKKPKPKASPLDAGGGAATPDERIDAIEGELSELRAGLEYAVELLLGLHEEATGVADAKAARAEREPSPHEHERAQRLEAARRWAERQRRIRDGG